MPSMLGEIQVQKTTLSGIWCDFILLFISMLKICKWSCDAPATVAFNAMTLETGFIRALSAVMGLLLK